MKCALAGGLVGLLLGLLSALLSWKDNGSEIGAFAVVVGLAEVLLWSFGGALVGGGGAFLGLWLAERKLGLQPEPPGLDLVLQKTSYLHGLLTETQKSYHDIADRVTLANQHLDAAGREFDEGAFAPFWDEIERAANELAAYKNEVEHLQRNVGVYNNESLELVRIGGDAPAPLALSQFQLSDARPSAARFMSMVRKAQTNFQFAMIFEQRKTNQLLHTGFGTLGSAIHSLGESINASLDKLSKSLDANTDRMLSYQDPLRHSLSKLTSRPAKPAKPVDAIERLQRYDSKPN